MRQQKVCNAAEINKVAWECEAEEKFRTRPMDQERTKTQNFTKITNTTIEDTSEYSGYVYMMVIIIGLL